MWKPSGNPKVVKVTHALANLYAEMQACPNDRPIRKAITTAIASAVNAGDFRSCSWASCFCKETGVEYRINGKHTSNVFASMNGTLPTVYVTIERYEADNLEDVAKLYATFDTRVSARTARDIYLAFAASDNRLATLPSSIIGLAATGLSFARWENGSQVGHPPEERAGLLLDHPEFALFLHDILKGDCRHIKRGPVAAAMSITFEKCKSASSDFWSLVRDESGPRNDTPDRVLAKYLRKKSINVGGGAKSSKDSVSTREVFVKCIHAWNAWRRGAISDLKYFSDAKTPVAV